jgi:hypothetical protein
MSYRSQGVFRYRESVRSLAHDRLDPRAVSAEMFVEPDVNGKAAAGLSQRRLFTCSLAEPY